MTELLTSLPTLDTVAAEVAAEMLRHYLPGAALAERRHHIGVAVMVGARQLVGETLNINHEFWYAIDDLDEVLQDQQIKEMTYEIHVMIRILVSQASSVVPSGSRTPNQRLNQEVLGAALPLIETLARQSIDIGVVIEELARLRRGESPFVHLGQTKKGQVMLEEFVAPLDNSHLPPEEAAMAVLKARGEAA